PALRARVLAARPHSGTPARLRRVARGASARRASFAADAPYAWRPRPHVRALRPTQAGARSVAQTRVLRQRTLRLAARVCVDSVRARRRGAWLPLAREGLRRSFVRSDLDEGRSAV